MEVKVRQLRQSHPRYDRVVDGYGLVTVIKIGKRLTCDRRIIMMVIILVDIEGKGHDVAQ